MGVDSLAGHDGSGEPARHPGLVEVRAVEPYRLWVRYDDGVEGDVDLFRLAGTDQFAAWDDSAAFADVSVDSSRGLICWGDDVAVNYCVVHAGLTGRAEGVYIGNVRAADSARAVAVRAVEPYRLWVRYDDGVEGEVDLSHVAGRGVFAAWDDSEFFADVTLDDVGVICWGDNIDYSPHAVYMALTGIPAGA